MNVHLQISPNSHEVRHLIEEFNTFLQQKKRLSRYHITPYYPHFPLHITLYMTDFPTSNFTLIKEYTQKLGTHWQTLHLTAQDFIASPQGYVMLRLQKNKTIQSYADALVTALAPLRALSTPIPAWAQQDPKRVTLCKQYGSPSVFNYFNPHLSVFSADHLSTNQHKLLYKDLQEAIQEFTRTHPIKIPVQASALGIGIANEAGQITQELWTFKLQPS